MRFELFSRASHTLLPGIIAMMFVVIAVSPCFSQSSEASCDALRDKWEQTLKGLKDKMDELAEIQNTPVERIIRRPLVVQGPQTKTVARQISEAMQIKEDMLNERRKICRELVDLEEQVFGPYRDCLNDLRGGGKKEAEKIAKKRRTVLDKTVVALAEVREVEGRDSAMPYSQAWRGQDFSRRGGGWQGYQQQYRGWWGY